MLLATSALASAALPAMAAPVDAVWSENPGSGDFNTANNWVGSAVPNGIATFATSNTRDVTVTQNVTVGGMTLTAGAGNYTFTVEGNLHIGDSGIDVQNGASATIVVAHGVAFNGSSSAGTTNIIITSSGPAKRRSPTTARSTSKATARPAKRRLPTTTY